MNQAFWTPEDAVAFREFATKHPNFFRYFDSGKPKKLKPEEETMERAALNAKLRDGYDDARNRLDEMFSSQPQQEPNSAFLDTSRDS